MSQHHDGRKVTPVSSLIAPGTRSACQRWFHLVCEAHRFFSFKGQSGHARGGAAGTGNTVCTTSAAAGTTRGFSVKHLSPRLVVWFCDELLITGTQRTSASGRGNGLELQTQRAGSLGPIKRHIFPDSDTDFLHSVTCTWFWRQGQSHPVCPSTDKRGAGLQTRCSPHPRLNLS